MGNLKLWFLVVVILFDLNHYYAASQNLGHFCNEADAVEEILPADCSLMDELERNGFAFDDELTAVGRYDGNIDYNTCIFIGRKSTKCCDGWKGFNCDEAICRNECLNNGVCDSPNHCDCKGTNHCGPTCNFTADDYGSPVYCFTDGKCQSEMTSSNLMSLLECCYLRNGVSYKQCARDECLTCRGAQYSYPPVDSKFSGVTGASSTCSGSNGFTKTFDGLMFIYEACCSYVLLRNQLETVVLEMTGCESSAHGNIGLSVELGDNRNIFMNAYEVRINGIHVEVQPGYAEGALKIIKNGIYNVLEYGRLKCGISDDLWFVKYEANEEKRVTGICGNKNNDPKDDMDKKSMVEFINHWKADPFHKCKEATEVTFDNTNNEEVKKKIVEACIFLKRSPFSKCHDKVDVRLLFDKCLSEYCTKSIKNKTEVAEVTCRLGGQYAAECGRKGVLLEWRNKGFCYKSCSNPDMVYTEFNSQCDPSCSNSLGIEPCPHEEKYPGCQCKPGMLQEGDKCYKPKDCPCVFDGILYEAGKVVKKDCNNCTCIFGSWSCTKIGCPKTCSVFGLNQVITFDGFSYSHNGPSCEYILVQHSGSLNYEENFLRITVETETLGNPNSIFTRPKLVKLILKKLYKSTTVEVRMSSVRSWVTLDGVSISEERKPIQNDLVFVLITDWQVVVQGDNEQLKVEVFGGIDIRLGEIYMSQVSGLCGNWNNKADDELRSSSGIVESSTSFSMSFSNCDTRLFPKVPPHDPCMGQTDVTVMLQKLCKAFNDDDKCSRSKQSVDYEEICLKHQCAELLSPEAASNDASFDKKFLYYGIKKVMECINQGHIDVDYIVNDPTANTTFFCPPGLKFHVCGSPIKSCRQLSTYSKYENFQLLGKTCFPGCLCSDGKFLDENEECVSASKCPCYDDEGGKTYKDGDEIVKDCILRQCTHGKWLDSPVPQTAVCGTGFIHYDKRQDCNTTCENFDKCWSAKTICDGCICSEGKVMDENGKCILPEDCPCLHDNKHYKPGETVDTKSTRCTCIVKRWVCEDKDDYKPSCTLTGDVYVTRFDGVHETNPGLNSCAYVLVASDDGLLSLDGCVRLSITAQNLPCGQSGIICNKVISVEYDSKKVLLTRGKHPTIDGEEVNLDSGFHRSPFLTVTYNQVMTLLLFNNGLSILYDGATRVYINLPHCYKHYVDGLCGRFGDELKSDDLGGRSTWKDDPTCPESSSYKIPKCEDDAKLTWATATCSIITTGKMFEKCRMVVDYQAYHSNCIASTCSCEVGRDCECTCTAISNFAKACASHNICVHWRSNELCPIMCPEGQHYEPCGDPVSQSCYGNLTNDQLSLSDEEMNVEGCYCSHGQVLNSKGICVEKQTCDCVHEGITFASNATILVDCRNCLCHEGKFQCEGDSCQKCEDDEFQCEGPNLKLVCQNELLKCDGNEDCIDGADEKDCSNVCDKTSNFFCGPSNECLPPSFICDGQVDCLDAKDEANCSKCEGGTTECHLSGICIAAQFICDGSPDCTAHNKDDMSDEEGCPKETTSTAWPKRVPKYTIGSSTEADKTSLLKSEYVTQQSTHMPLTAFSPYVLPIGPPTVFPTVPPAAPKTALPTAPPTVFPTFPTTAAPVGLSPAPSTVFRTAPRTSHPKVPPTIPPVAPRTYPLIVSQTARPTVLPTVPHIATPIGLSPGPRTINPTTPLTGPLKVFPTSPPVAPRTNPPKGPSTAIPAVYPTTPLTGPLKVFPTSPPVAPRTNPPKGPSTAIPAVYPTVPPAVRSTARTAPLVALPTTSLKSELTTYKKAESATDKLKHCKPFKLLENGRVKFSKLSGNSRLSRKQRLILNLTETHFVVYLNLDFLDATEVSMSTNNKTHKGTFLHLTRKHQGNGVMQYSAYPMYLVDALSINFTSNLGFDGLQKVEMSGCHPGLYQTTVRPFKSTEKQTVTLGPYKPTSPKSETCEPFDLMEKNSSLLNVNYTKGNGIKSAELLHFQLNGTFIIHSIYLELHEADMISIHITDAAGKAIPIKLLKERHATRSKTNILSAFINSRVDHILLELGTKEGDWKTKVIKILGCPLLQKTDISLPSTKVYKPSLPGTLRPTEAPKTSKPSQLFSSGPITARYSTQVTEPKTFETSQPVSTARKTTKTSTQVTEPKSPETSQPISITRKITKTSTRATTGTSQPFSTPPMATTTGIPCPFDVMEDQRFIADYRTFTSAPPSETSEFTLTNTFDISLIYLQLFANASASIFISNATDINVPMTLVRNENSTKDIILTTRPDTRVDVITLVLYSYNVPWTWKVMGCPASFRTSLFTPSTTSKLILPETLNPRKEFATSPSSEYTTTQRASTEETIPMTPPDEIIEQLKPPCKPQRLIKSGRAKFGKLSTAAQKMRNQRVNLLFTEKHFVVYMKIEFKNASEISVSATNETHRGTFLNLTEDDNDDGVIHLTGYPMLPADYISINFTSDAGFESLTKMEVGGCHHEKEEITLTPQPPTASGKPGLAEEFPSTAKPIRHVTIPSISMPSCQPFDLMEEPDENFKSINFSITNKDPLRIEYELKLNGTFVINIIYLEIIHAESVSVLFGNATHSKVALLPITNEDFGPNKYLLISKPAARVDNMTLILTLKSQEWEIEVMQVIGCPQVNKTTIPRVTTAGPEFPETTLPSSGIGPSTSQSSEGLKKCQISKFIEWDVCYVEKDSTAGISRKDEECRPGDLVDNGVSVSFDCLYCLCSDGRFDCQQKIGEFRESFDSCTMLNCTEEGEAVLENPKMCSCPGEAPKPLSPPQCECNCPPTETPTTPRSTTGQTPTSSTTKASDVCPTSAPSNLAQTQQTPCSLVTVNYTFAEVAPEECLRDEIIPVKTCTGSCQTSFKVTYHPPGLATLTTLSCSCCQATEFVKREVKVSCPGYDKNILVTEAAACNCNLSGCLQ